MAKSNYERYKSWYYREVRKQAKASLSERMSDDKKHTAIQERMKTIRKLSPMLSKEEYNTRYAERDLWQTGSGILIAKVNLGTKTGLNTWKFASLISAIKQFEKPEDPVGDNADAIKQGIAKIIELQGLDDDTLYLTLAGQNDELKLTEEDIKNIYRALNYAQTWKNIS